jgi:hypothetical protein
VFKSGCLLKKCAQELTLVTWIQQFAILEFWQVLDGIGCE